MPLSIAERIRELKRRGVEGVELVDELTRMMDELPKREKEVDGAQRIRDNRVEILCSMGIVGTE